MFDNVKNKSLFNFFKEISYVPRSSGNVKKIADYLEKFAKDRNLDYVRDEVDNVFIRKNATFGSEGPAVLLQGHMDMVAVCDEGIEHNFEKEPLKLIVDGDILKAEGTTLGADNGVAVAAMLAILDSKDIKHPDIECLFTVDEEVGMIGISNFDFSLAKARMMINMDSSENGTVVSAGAGGIHTEFSRKPKTENAVGLKFYKFDISGLYGGHSGEDIIANRTNSIEAAVKFLRYIRRSAPVYLVSLFGGEKANAIPRSCSLVFATEDDSLLEKDYADYSEVIRHELIKDDFGYNSSLEKTDSRDTVISLKDSDTLIDLISVMNSGPVKMSPQVNGLADTSYNLSIVRADTEDINILVSSRSVFNPSILDIALRNRSFASLSGYEYKESDYYTSWAFEENSPLRDAYFASYEKLTGKSGKTIGIHAGLECGLVKDYVSDMDIISIGPEIKDMHSPSETLGIASFDLFYDIVVDLLSNL